jgi:hypothetical protein
LSNLVDFHKRKGFVTMSMVTPIGEVCQLRVAVTNQEPWPFEEGSLCTIIGRDGPMVRVRMHEHHVILVVWPRVLEPEFASLSNAA